MTAPVQSASYPTPRLNPKKDAPDMQTDSNPVQGPFQLKVVTSFDENATPTVPGPVYTGLRKNRFSLNRRTATTMPATEALPKAREVKAAPVAATATARGAK